MHLAGFLLAASASAHADLYRWVDPATGSVKFSSLPPADATIEPDVVRYNAPRAGLAEIERRWRALLAQLATLNPQDVRNGGTAVREQLKEYESARAELDRRDPAGASRRAAEAATTIERLKPVQR